MAPICEPGMCTYVLFLLPTRVKLSMEPSGGSEVLTICRNCEMAADVHMVFSLLVEVVGALLSF